MSVAANKREWEELGELDPLWAIAAGTDRRFGRWELDAFFEGGQREVNRAMAQLEALGAPAARGTVLDFGCGVGRVTRALAREFEQAVGLDISEAMLARAREVCADVPNVSFEHNAAADLRVLGERRFDLVYTRIVLQHVAGRDLARSYIQEFLRVLASGGMAVFQIPVHIPRRYRFMPVRRLYVAGRAVGLPASFLYNRLHLHPIRMQWVPEHQVRAWVEQAGGRVRHVEHARSRSGVRHGTFFADRP